MSLPKFRSFPSRRSASSPIVRGRGRRRPRPRFTPSLLWLEARALLSTLTVTNDDDSGTGSLRAQLAAAQSGDSIDFSPEAYGTITLTSGPLAVATDVDIQGPGASLVTVSGDAKSDVVEVQSGVTATISGLTITDGSYAVAGGIGGGGILNHGTLTVSDDVVTGNAIAPGSGAFGGGGIANLGTLTITDSTISGNTGVSGGGISNTGPLTIAGSTISGNTSVQGGGILSFANASLTQTVVSDNTATGGTGGGIDILPGLGATTSTLMVTDGIISGNTIIPSSGNAALAIGAGISAFDSVVTVTGSYITNNTASARQSLGGGIAMETNFSPKSGSVLTVSGCYFVGDQAVGTGSSGQANGGAIHTDPGATIAVSGSSFIDNAATATGAAQGGAMDLAVLVSGIIDGSDFAGNQAVVSSTSASGGSGTGGAIANGGGSSPSVLTINGSLFSTNLAQGSAGGGFGLGGAIFNRGNVATLNISSSLFDDNRASGGAASTSRSGTFGGFGAGGGLVNFLGATATVSGSAFIGNSATGGAATAAGDQGGPGQGGAIQNESATLTMTGDLFIGNNATGGDGSGGATGGNGEGGGIQNGGGTLKVSGAAVIGNSAIGGAGGGNGEGGGVYTSGKGGSVSLTDVLITLNSAIGGSGGGSGYGGGLYIATGALTTLKNTTVLGNFASTAGDDIYGA